MDNNKPVDKLFVYGTLRLGFDHPLGEFLSETSERMGMATTEGHLYLIGHYPGMIRDTRTYRRVKGELLQLKGDIDDVMNRVDDYEECSSRYPEPHEYRREVISVTDETGQAQQAWAYVYNQPVLGLREIRSGDFLDEVSDD